MNLHVGSVYKINLSLCRQSPYDGKLCKIIGPNLNLGVGVSPEESVIVKILEKHRGVYPEIAIDPYDLEAV